MLTLDSETIDLPTPSGPMRTCIFRPAPEGRFPGVVLFSEIFQITGPIRRAARFLAGHGYLVAVPEIFHELEAPGAVLAYDEPGAARGNAHKIAKPIAAYDADARAALDFLAASPRCTGALAALGICIGGHLAFRACFNNDVLAGACFYATDIHKRSLGKGMRDDTLDRMRDIKGEMLMIWGRQDPHIPREGRAIILNAMEDAKLNFTWHEFNGQHAFMRDEGHRYDAALARLCWELVLDLFTRTLR
jgi:carboxymethylenebutenolidase